MTRLTRLFSLSFCVLSAFFAIEAAGDDAAPPTGSNVERLHLPEVTQTRLDNGLTVVMEENHHSPFVSMQLRYAAGSRDDSPGKEGLALLTARTMTMATKHVPWGAYEKWLDRVGASDRGWATNHDATSEWATVPSSAVPVMLWLWSDQMGFFFADDPKVLESAREISRNERREKVDNVAYGAVREIAMQALYPKGHPYHLMPIASAIDGLTSEDVRQFHDRYLAPNAAVLVLSGDFRPAEVTEQIRKYFAEIPAGEAASHVPSPARFDGNVRLDVAASVQAPWVVMHWRTPAYFDAGDAELDIASRVLSGGRLAFLYWALVDQEKLATSVTAHQYSRALGSDFQILAVVAPGHTPEQVIAGIDRVLARVRGAALSDAGLRAAHDSVTIPRFYELERPARRATLFGEYTLLRHDPGWLASDVGRFEAATANDIRAAIATWLTPDHRVVTVVTPDRTAPPCGELRATKGAP